MAWRVLVLTLEFTDPIFSGNGVYARSIVHNLIGRSGLEDGEGRRNVAEALVICGCPEGQVVSSSSKNAKLVNSKGTHGSGGGGGENVDRVTGNVNEKSSENRTDHEQQESMENSKRNDLSLKILTVTVPTWYTLDKYSSWKEDGLGAVKYADQVRSFKPDIVLCVDWHGTLALQTLKSVDALVHVPSIYLNFRIFSKSTGISDQDRRFYEEKEALSIRVNQATVALCKNDARILTELNNHINNQKEKLSKQRKSVFLVLNPPLRAEMRNLVIRQQNLNFNFAKQLSMYRKTVRCVDRAIQLYGSELEAPGLNNSKAYTRSQSLDGSAKLQEDLNQSDADELLSPMVEEDLRSPIVEDLPVTTGKTSPLRRSKSAGTTASNASSGSSQHSVSHSATKAQRKNSFGAYADEQDRVQHGFGGPRPVILSYLKAQSRAGLVSGGSEGSRKFITCCCRVCPEKNVQQFVDVISSLSEFLKANQIIPCLVGPPTDDEFANKIYKQLDQLFPGNSSKVVPKFASFQEIAGIFSETLLNFHPALYEAYGMTMVEAAVFGAPSIMHGAGTIGAQDVLVAPRCGFLANMTSVKETAAVVKSILHPSKREMLTCVGSFAREAAMGWGDKEFGDRLFAIMEQTLQNRFRSYQPQKAAAFLSSSISSSSDSEEDQEHEQNEGQNQRRWSLEEEEEVQNISSSKGENANPSNGNQIIQIHDEWLWMQILEWVLTNHTCDSKVVNFDLLVVQNVGESLAKLELYEFARRLEAEWHRVISMELNILNKEKQQLQEQEQEQDNDKSPSKTNLLVTAKKRAKQKMVQMKRNETTQWAKYFMDESKFPTVSQARYRLVPSRIPEVAFWNCFFNIIKRALLFHLENDPFQSLQKLAEKGGTSLMSQLSEASNRGLKKESVLDRPDSNLRSVAIDLCKCEKFLVIAGYPSVSENEITPQKTDGPVAATLLLKAVNAVGKIKSGSLLVEEINSFAFQACMGVFFGTHTQRKSDWNGFSEQSFYTKSGSVSIETFSAGEKFAEPQSNRLSELAKELCESQLACHCMAVERIGPSKEGIYYTNSANIMSRSHIAPLHRLISFSLKLFQNHQSHLFQTSAVVSTGSTFVGMGSRLFQNIITSKIPLGDQVGCTLETDHVLIGSQATLEAFALAASIALVAAEQGLVQRSEKVLNDIMGTPEEIEKALEACTLAGSWDETTEQRSKTIHGVDYHDLVAIFTEMRLVVLYEWEQQEQKQKQESNN